MRRGTALLALLFVAASELPASAAGPSLLFDVSNGKVLYAEDPDNQWHPASLTKLMTAYLAFEAVKSGKLALNSKITCSAAAQRRAAEQGRAADRRRAHGRSGAAGAHHQIRQRRRRHAGRGGRRQRGRLRRQDERDGPAARHVAHQVRQSQRPAGRRSGDDRARPRQAVARHRHRLPRVRALLVDAADAARQEPRALAQRAARHRRGRRRHEDRLHLRLRLQHRGQRHARRAPPRRGRARAMRAARSATCAPPACSSTASSRRAHAGLQHADRRQHAAHPYRRGRQERAQRASTPGPATRKPRVINAHKGGKKTAKKGAKKDKDAVKAAQASAEADTTTGTLQTEVKPVLRAEEE